MQQDPHWTMYPTRLCRHPAASKDGWRGKRKSEKDPRYINRAQSNVGLNDLFPSEIAKGSLNFALPPHANGVGKTFFPRIDFALKMSPAANSAEKQKQGQTYNENSFFV